MKLKHLTTALFSAFALGAVSAASAAEMPAEYADHSIVITTIEYLTDAASGEPGGIEILQADTGNGQLSQDFVYNDPRNNSFDGGIPGVSYAITATNLSSDARLLNQLGSMQGAVDVWDNLQCSDMGLTQVFNPPAQGIVEIFFNTGALPLIQVADVTQIGFKSAAEFPYFAANPNVLGVAFTLSWVDANGNLTDIDNNGKSDVAFREIYYNDEYEWADDGTEGNVGGVSYIDFPTVANHEHGHGFSMAHFGIIKRNKDGSLKATPRALMNAIYGGTFREPAGRDNGSHCSNWAQWPNN